MEVLRSAPGSLQEQLPHLPPPLVSLAALAHTPSLAVVCSPAPECADQSASVEHTALMLCVSTTAAQEQPVAVASTTELVADGVAGASMWLRMDEDVTDDDIERDLFTLESRPGVAVCRLLAMASSLQGTTIFLPESVCLVLGSGNLKLRGVTFQGVSCFTSCCSFLLLMSAPFRVVECG